MNDKDNQGFEVWVDSQYSINPYLELSAYKAWEAALEYERNIGQRVYDLFNKNIDVLDAEIYKLQNENKKLKDLLELSLKTILELWSMPDVVHLDDHGEVINEIEKTLKGI